jgi:hypothetical protein
MSFARTNIPMGASRHMPWRTLLPVGVVHPGAMATTLHMVVDTSAALGVVPLLEALVAASTTRLLIGAGLRRHLLRLVAPHGPSVKYVLRSAIPPMFPGTVMTKNMSPTIVLLPWLPFRHAIIQIAILTPAPRIISLASWRN